MTTPSVPDLPVLLTVRGALAKSIDEVRATHNETAGSPPGIANARGLGDLSHHVYAPVEDDKLSSAKEGELLFMDTWVAADGILKFFSDERVQHTSTLLFSEREPNIWMPARGAFTFAQPAPMGRNGRYVGLIRGIVQDPGDAIAKFARGIQSGISAARRRGLLSHADYVKLPMPGTGTEGPVEVLGVELWCDLDGLKEHYTDAEAMSQLGGVFAGRPDASVWQQAPGQWNEW